MAKFITCFVIFLISSVAFVSGQEQRAIARDRQDPEVVQATGPFGSFRYRALLIGNNEYQHWDNLRTAIHDVEELSEVLKSSYGFLQEDIILLKDATRRETLQAFRELQQKSQPEDRLLVYYAGHGFSDSGSQRGYWVPVDAADQFDYLPNEVIRKELEIIQAKHKLLIADSCFSGTFVTTQRSLGTELNWREEGYYVNKSADPSFQTLTSGSNEPVFDGGAAWGGHSIFAHHLLSKLRNNLDPYFPSKKLGQHLEEQVANDVAISLGAEQTPIFSAIYPGHAGGEFFFLKPELSARNVIFQPPQQSSRSRQQGHPKMLMIFRESDNPASNELFSQARQPIFEQLAQNLSSGPFRVMDRHLALESVNPRKISGLMINNGADWGLVLTLDGKLEKQQSFLWKGIATATLELEIWQRDGEQARSIGVWNPALQKLPSRQWLDNAEFKEKLMEQALLKVLEKSDFQALQQLLTP